MDPKDLNEVVVDSEDEQDDVLAISDANGAWLLLTALPMPLSIRLQCPPRRLPLTRSLAWLLETRPAYYHSQRGSKLSQGPSQPIPPLHHSQQMQQVLPICFNRVLDQNLLTMLQSHHLPQTLQVRLLLPVPVLDQDLLIKVPTPQWTPQEVTSLPPLLLLNQQYSGLYRPKRQRT